MPRGEFLQIQGDYSHLWPYENPEQFVRVVGEFQKTERLRRDCNKTFIIPSRRMFFLFSSIFSSSLFFSWRRILHSESHFCTSFYNNAKRTLIKQSSGMADDDANAMMRNMSKAGHRVKPPRATRVKNNRRCDPNHRRTNRPRSERETGRHVHRAEAKITNNEELYEYRLKKRKEFEDVIRRTYWDSKVWTRYAGWEEGQGFCDEREASGNARWIKIIKKSCVDKLRGDGNELGL